MQAEAWPAWALVKRELLRGLRKKRAFLLAFLAVAASALVVFYAWPKAGPSPYGGMATSYAAQRIMRAVSWVLWSACVFAVPALASSTIVSEREEETFDLLLTSLVRPSMVVLTKFAVVVAWYALVAVAVVPVMASVLYLAGLDLRELAYVWVALGSLAVLLAAVGTGASAMARSSFRAVLASYGVTALLILGLPVAALFLGSFTPYALQPQRMGQPGAIEAALPLYFFLGVLEGSPSLQVVVSGAVAEAVAAAAVLALAIRATARERRPRRIETEKPIDDPTELKRRRAHFPFYLIDPLKRKKPVEDGRNPVFVRELRWGFQNRQGAMIRAFYLLLIVYFVFGAVMGVGSSRGTAREMRIWALGQALLPLLIAPALLPNAISREVAREQLDFLRSTLLRPSAILAGKAMAGFVLSIPLYLALSVSLVIMKFVLRLPWLLVMQSLVTCVVFCLVALAVGLCVSTATRRGPVAVILSYLGTFLVLGGALAIAQFAAALIWGPAPLAGRLQALQPAQALIAGSVGAWARSMALFTCGSLGLFAVAVLRFRNHRSGMTPS